MRVFVLDNKQKPLMPCSPARARKLLRLKKAAVFRQSPFTIILKKRSGGKTQPLALNVDPGSKITGVTLVADFASSIKAISALEVEHRGHTVKKKLDSRRAVRRSRRQRNTRYRPARFLNRKKSKGWLPPSLMSRVYNVETWAKRLQRFVPITSSNVETARFDTQILENPNISGCNYQKGALYGFELREYLLHRHQHRCAYCEGLSNDPILNLDHIVPKRLGGVDRVANLVIACRTCNKHKGGLHPKVWLEQCLKKKSKLDQKRAVEAQKILKGYRPTMRNAAAVNATRFAVGRAIKDVIGNVNFWSGGRTKKNRTSQNYIKDHWVDAACIGVMGQSVELEPSSVLTIRAQGHGSRRKCNVDKFGFPRSSAKATKFVKGFQTGDIVKANIPKGKYKGKHQGRVAVRASGSFDIKTKTSRVSCNFQYCKKIHACDGYGYSFRKVKGIAFDSLHLIK